MSLKFTKMHGIGNDYIYINCFNNEPKDPKKLSEILSNRHFAIGGDGVVLICKSSVADARMKMYNLDGSERKMCGNAIRCVAKFMYEDLNIKKDCVTVETASGIKTLYLHINNKEVNSVRVDMGKPELTPAKIPVLVECEAVINYPINIKEKQYNITCVSMGNPHAVVFMDSITELDLPTIGVMFEKNDIFPESVNTEFVKVIDQTTVSMRVWERGSGETQACGTGACAVVVACVLNGYCKKDTDITVKLLGGDLIINYTDDTVFMTGGCTKSFEGKLCSGVNVSECI